MANSARNLNEVKAPDAADDLKGRSSDAFENLNSKSRQLLQDAQGRVSEFYDLSNNWIQENRLVTMIGVAALAGILGFFIGRRGTENRDQIEV